MRKSVFLPLLAMPALAGCFGDDPDNTPLYGQWEMATEVDSVTFDGMILPLEQMPPEFAAIQGSENRCGEPKFTDVDWQEDDINRQVMGECTMDSYTVTPTRVDGTGVCQIGQGNMTSSPRLTVGIDQAEDSYRMVVSMEGSVVDPATSQSHTYRVIAVQEGTRTGDC